MRNRIGIRHEDKYLSEKRAPLTPHDVKLLTRDKHLEIVVQSSAKRIFTDQEYRDAGAIIADDLRDCPVILGVKEIPMEKFEAGKTYMFFSHVIKGQQYNMPMLQELMHLGCNLIDYERIINDRDKRMVFFGHYAGLAGMINSLWALGLRLKEYGFKTPFLKIKQSHLYHSLEEARADISEVGLDIAEDGLPQELQPFTIGFTGYGHVSQGAQEICNLLPIKEITPSNLHCLDKRKHLPNNVIYKIVFHKEHMAAHNDGLAFDAEDYKFNPQNYHSIFENHLPNLSVLINCIYWNEQFPRLLTKEYVAKSFTDGSPKLTVIGDITCDANGSIEITHKGTEIEDPIFVYHPDDGSYTMGHKGKGMLVMAVDILPAELPRDSSGEFSDSLFSLIKPLASCDFSKPFYDLNLPRPLKKALIVHKGELTHDYKYLKAYLNKRAP